MPGRRILSLWFPHLGAERVLRRLGLPGEACLGVVAEDGARQVLSSVSPGARAAGLAEGQALRDAFAMCPQLVVRPQDAPAEAAFLDALTRWGGRFSPWVAPEAPAALMLDITGCAHLFGGEAAMMERAMEDARALGLTARAGLADTPGAAWALARFAGQGPAPAPAGDMIEQEARATRSRA
ncbi:Y-family DNA polymerase, partial [Roseovarius salinarum]|uniref:Y-family DNA polymerase n=1 Tax=Roseovarius salinarum TaxID=1981892 RepID=UPI0018E44042